MPNRPLADTERKLGCGCILVPGGLALTALLCGLAMAEGPQPGGSIGVEPERPLKFFAVMGLLVLTVVGGSALLNGCPNTRRRAISAGLGWFVAVVGGFLSVKSVEGISVVVFAGAAWSIFAFMRDQPVDADPSEIQALSRQLALKWGRAFVGFAAFLATFGLWAAWPRDPTKTTSAPEATVFCAFAFAGFGYSLLRRSHEGT